MRQQAHLRNRLLLTTILTATVSATAALPALADGNVVQWVDDNGVTHFGDRQFAPPDAHTPVEIKPANRMDVPATPRTTARSKTSGPTVVTLDRSKLENKRGFRGYESRPSASQSRRNYRH